MVKQSQSPDISKSAFDFLKTELHTGMTLAGIAKDAEDPEKASRNRKNARLAYDTVVKTRPKAILSPTQEEEVSNGLQQLRKVLEKLGEHFQRE